MTKSQFITRTNTLLAAAVQLFGGTGLLMLALAGTALYFRLLWESARWGWGAGGAVLAWWFR